MDGAHFKHRSFPADTIHENHTYVVVLLAVFSYTLHNQILTSQDGPRAISVDKIMYNGRKHIT